MFVSAQPPSCRQKVKSTKPGNSNALERAGFLFRLGGGRLRSGPPASAGGRIRGRGAHRPDTWRRRTTPQGRAGIGPNSSASAKERQARNFPQPSRRPVSLRCVFVRVGIRVTRHGTAAFRPAKENSPRPPHVLFATLRTTSESGGVGRSMVPTGNSPSSDTILPGLTFAFSSVCGMWHEMIRTEGGTGERIKGVFGIICKYALKGDMNLEHIALFPISITDYRIPV